MLLSPTDSSSPRVHHLHPESLSMLALSVFPIHLPQITRGPFRRLSVIPLSRHSSPPAPPALPALPPQRYHGRTGKTATPLLHISQILQNDSTQLRLFPLQNEQSSYSISNPSIDAARLDPRNGPSSPPYLHSPLPTPHSPLPTLHAPLKSQKINLGGGLPNPSTFPFAAMTVTLKDSTTLTVSESEMQRALQYSSTTGLPDLLSWIRQLQTSVHSPST